MTFSVVYLCSCHERRESLRGTQPFRGQNTSSTSLVSMHLEYRRHLPFTRNRSRPSGIGDERARAIIATLQDTNSDDGQYPSRLVGYNIIGVKTPMYLGEVCSFRSCRTKDVESSFDGMQQPHPNSGIGTDRGRSFCRETSRGCDASRDTHLPTPQIERASRVQSWTELRTSLQRILR